MTTLPGLIACEAFVPHSLQHLTEAKVFPSPLPEAAYTKMLEEYYALSDVDVWRIAYDSDGLKVTGLMALPKEIRPHAHPLLIYNRGGNQEFGKLTLLSVMRSMVPFARRGYVVFASNYRGNDGGEGVEEFGGSDVDDVLNLLAMARHHAGFDGKNAFMLGHSRGAMMTYLAIRRGAALNAAIGIAGVADLRLSGQQRPELEYQVFQRLIPGEGEARQQEYIKRSAVCWAEELRVPLLLLHGDADPAVDVSQSLALADALKRAGRPYALHIYPGGNHALLRQWDDVLARCTAWLERWRQ